MYANEDTDWLLANENKFTRYLAANKSGSAVFTGDAEVVATADWSNGTSFSN